MNTNNSKKDLQSVSSDDSKYHRYFITTLLYIICSRGNILLARNGILPSRGIDKCNPFMIKEKTCIIYDTIESASVISEGKRA